MYSLIFLISCLTVVTNCYLYQTNLMAKAVKKFEPEVYTKGSRTIHKYPKHKIEVTLSFGITEERVRFLEALIETYYGEDSKRTINDITKMAEIIESTFGGYWSILFLDDPFGYASTIYKRSPTYVVFDVDGEGIAIAKEPVGTS